MTHEHTKTAALLRALLLVIAGCALVAASSTAVAWALPETGSDTGTEIEVQTAPDETTPELPREWRWTRPAISFDDMYRR